MIIYGKCILIICGENIDLHQKQQRTCVEIDNHTPKPHLHFPQIPHGQRSKVVYRNEEFGCEDFDCRLVTSDIHKKESRL